MHWRKPDVITLIDSSADNDVQVVASGNHGFCMMVPVTATGTFAEITAYDGTANTDQPVEYLNLTTSKIMSGGIMGPKYFSTGLFVECTASQSDWLVYAWTNCKNLDRMA